MFSDVVTVNGKAVLVTDAMFAPDPALYVRAAANRDGVIAAVAQASGMCQVVDSLGQRWDSGDVAFGQNCVGINALPLGRWEVTWMRAPIGATYGRVVLNADLAPTTAAMQQYPAPFGNTSQGFIDVEIGGVPVMTDQNVAVVCGGHRISHPMIRGSWTVGDSNDFYGVAAWDASTQTFYKVWAGNVQTRTLFALVDGLPVVAVANQDILVPFERFEVWRPQPAVAVVTDFPPAPIRVIPDTFPGVPNLADVYAWGTFHIGDNRELDVVVAAAKRDGKPSLGYYDQLFQADKIASIPAALDVIGINAYPSGDLRQGIAPEPIRDTADRARRNVRACQQAKRPCCLFVGVYTGSGAWNLQYVLDLLRALWDVAAECGVDVVPYGNTRPPVFPEFVRALTNMLAAAKGRPAPAPKPKPIPVPPTHEDDMPKTNPTDSLTYAAVDAALAPRAPGRNYTDGCLDAYRALAEGTPLAKVAAGESHPTQSPVPAVTYPMWAATALGLLAARQSAGKGTGYGDGVMDTFRRFGGERWPLEFVVADIEGASLPDRPWPSF
ncbi:MAG: hypothetical protein ABI634_18305 [Acidobacteriota bacterium]